MSASWIYKNKELLQALFKIENINEEAIFIRINTSSCSEVVQNFLNLYIEELVESQIITLDDSVMKLFRKNVKYLENDFYDLLKIDKLMLKIEKLLKKKF